MRHHKRRSIVSQGLPFALGAVTGGLVTYLFDPSAGRGRRAKASDRAGAGIRRSFRQMGRWGRRLGAGAYGLEQKATHRGTEEAPADDIALAQKVRSEVFRSLDTPHGVNVDAVDGIVTLRGQVGAGEDVERIEHETLRVAGLWGVRNLLHLPGTPAPSPDYQRVTPANSEARGEGMT